MVPQNRPNNGRIQKGEVRNPGGRPKLPEELKAMRDATLAEAIRILHAKIHDKKYIAKLRPAELDGLLTTAFDRCGLPKVTQSEITGKDGGSLFMTIRMGDKAPA